MKLLANKLACAGDIITEKDFLIRVLNGLGPGYLDPVSIITTNKMSYDGAYALLLTHEGRLEQNQSAKTMFNANYSTMNVNHPYMRGNFRRGAFGNGHYGRSVNRGFNVGSIPEDFQLILTILEVMAEDRQCNFSSHL